MTIEERENILREATSHLDDITEVVMAVGLGSAVNDARSALRAGNLDEAHRKVAQAFEVATQVERYWDDEKHTPGRIGDRCRKVYNLLAKLH